MSASTIHTPSTIKPKQLIGVITAVIIIDQVFKIWIKTHFFAGQEVNVLGLTWFKLHFIENEGMAWGLQWGGNVGKITLTVFRFAAVIWGTFYLRKLLKKQYSKGFMICAGLVYAGALGNLIDSMFYGLVFNSSDLFTRNIAQIFPAGGGYTGFLQGKVVDMLYFPIIENGHFPSWIPILGGKTFSFFDPVFNIADTSISVGVFTILIFQKRFFRKKQRMKTKMHHNV